MRTFVTALASGHLDVLTVMIWTAVAALLAMAGGAAGAVRLAGKDLGNELAALMGAMFGAVGAVPGVLVALIILAFI